MPAQEIDRPNPTPLRSILPAWVGGLGTYLEQLKLEQEDLVGVKEFQAAACYIAAGKFFV